MKHQSIVRQSVLCMLVMEMEIACNSRGIRRVRAACKGKDLEDMAGREKLGLGFEGLLDERDCF